MVITADLNSAGNPYIEITCESTTQARGVRFFADENASGNASRAENVVTLNFGSGQELKAHRTVALIAAQYGYLPPENIPNYQRNFNL